MLLFDFEEHPYHIMDPYVLNNYHFMTEVNGGLSLVACIHSSCLSVPLSVFFF